MDTFYCILVWACVVWTVMTLPLYFVIAIFALVASKAEKRHQESIKQLLCEQKEKADK